MWKKITRSTLLLTFIFSLQACQSIPTISSSDNSANDERTAQQLLEKNKTRQASDIYSNLAEHSKDPEKQQHYQLRAIEALFEGGHLAEAQTKFSQLPDPLLNIDFELRLLILKANEALISGAPDLTIALLPEPDVLSTQQQQKQVYSLRAHAYQQLNQTADELQSRIQYEKLEASHQKVADNHNAIWELLSKEPVKSLNQMTTDIRGDTYQGWLELALILKSNTLNGKHLQRQISNWQMRFPIHPARSGFSASLLGTAMENLPSRTDIQNIAVLLPSSGPASEASAAIRDGIISAYLENADSTNPPTMKFYDTGRANTDILSIYHRAVDDGADIIVGPLMKAAVAQLAAEETLPTPILSLNHLEKGIISNNDSIIQFGLVPEDEAYSAAARATQLGYKKALILSTDDAVGERLAKAFQDKFTELNGQVIETLILKQDEYDYSSQLKSTLHINLSNRRNQRLQNVLGTSFKFEPTIRQDIDVIYLTHAAEQARTTRPQLLFFRARNIPLLASSRIYSGTIDRQKDSDLNNTYFCDNLWLLNPENTNNPLQLAISRNWPDKTALLRLYAFGADAIRLIPYIQNMKEDASFRFAGDSGELSLDQNNRIHRHLHWAVFKKGAPALPDVQI